MSLLSILPRTSNFDSATIFPRSSVAIKLQEYMLAKSIILIPPVFLFYFKLLASLISLINIFIHFGHLKIPFFFEYACDSSSVIPYSL